MLDRASTFADSEIVDMLKSQFVAVALDQAYERRQQDAKGELYRKIAGQGPRSDFNATTQGFYLAAADGTLLGYNNNRGPDRVRRVMRQALADYRPVDARPLPAGRGDPRYAVKPPEDGLVVRVRAKVLGGYDPAESKWQQIFQDALSRDNLWLTADEHQALVRGEMPHRVALRIARFHLVDNTRGEPPMWRPDEIRKLELVVDGNQVRGRVHLETRSGDRGFEADLLGRIETSGGRITQLDLVARGECWGQGRFTGHGPAGRFPLAIAFSLADGSDVADGIPPQGSRGWLAGYLEPAK